MTPFGEAKGQLRVAVTRLLCLSDYQARSYRAEARARRATYPSMPRPASISAYVEGSGIGVRR